MTGALPPDSGQMLNDRSGRLLVIGLSRHLGYAVGNESPAAIWLTSHSVRGYADTNSRSILIGNQYETVFRQSKGDGVPGNDPICAVGSQAAARGE